MVINHLLTGMILQVPNHHFLGEDVGPLFAHNVCLFDLPGFR